MLIIIVVASALFSASWILYQRYLKNAAIENPKQLAFVYEAKKNGYDVVNVYYKDEYLMSYKWKDGHKATPGTYIYKMHEHFNEYTKHRYRELIKPARIDGVAQSRKQ